MSDEFYWGVLVGEFAIVAAFLLGWLARHFIVGTRSTHPYGKNGPPRERPTPKPRPYLVPTLVEPANPGATIFEDIDGT